MKLLAYILACVVVFASFISEADADKRKRRRGDPVPVALRGGKEVQKRHNRAADADGLTRLRGLEGPEGLRHFIVKGYLVATGDTDAYYLNRIGGHDPAYADLYRYVRPWTKKFLDHELAEGRAETGHWFKIISLVRTDIYQGRICRSGNRAAVCGSAWWQQSLHLTGAAIDISKEGMPTKTRAWMRKRLLRLQRQGLVMAIEERGAFHVFVRKAYGTGAKKTTKAKKAQKTKKATHKKRKRGRTR